MICRYETTLIDYRHLKVKFAAKLKALRMIRSYMRKKMRKQVLLNGGKDDKSAVLREGALPKYWGRGSRVDSARVIDRRPSSDGDAR
ncbi:hypothetical protein Tco_1405616 [Tanacetum coccineum]